MQPHLLPEDLVKLIDGVELEQVLTIPMGDLCVYWSSDKVYETIMARGYLNMILRDESGRRFGFRIEELENAPDVSIAPAAVPGQERRGPLHAGAINAVYWDNGDDRVVCAYHWDGFETKFNAETMKTLAQTFKRF